MTRLLQAKVATFERQLGETQREAKRLAGVVEREKSAAAAAHSSAQDAATALHDAEDRLAQVHGPDCRLLETTSEVLDSIHKGRYREMR